MFKHAAILLTTTCAYYLAGLFGLELAIPPGFSSAVWPASGVALAIMILQPTHWVVIGTFIGSFLVNFQLVSNGFKDISWPNTHVPLGIATGASLQLLVGYLLHRRFIGDSIVTDVASTVIRFTFVVTGLSCLIAASIATSILVLNGVVRDDAAMFSWFTWWLGDSIGILLFTPMLLILSMKNSKLKLRRKFQIVVPSLLIFICTCLIFIWSLDTRQQTIEHDINERANHYTQKIQERLVISKNILHSYRAYFYGSDYVSFEEFKVFSKILLRNNDTLHGVGWTEIISHSQREKIEEIIQSQGYPDFVFTRPDKTKGMMAIEKKEKYYPVLYIYPYVSNKQALGLDLSSLPGRLEILESIKKEKHGKATSPITLVQEKENEKSVIIYLPVWADFKNKKTLKGYISGVFRMSGILGPVLFEAKKDNFDISISDMTQNKNETFLIKSGQYSQSYFSAVTRLVTFQDRQYRVTLQPNSLYIGKERGWINWVILIGGFLISALLQAFILMMTGAIEHTNKMVEIKTYQLTQAIEKAELASKAKSMFLANMSHELRTPLNAIVGLVNLCLRTELTNKQSEYLYQSKLATQTLMSLINQSLDYAKIESGKLELEEKEFDFYQVIKKLYAVFHFQSEEKNIAFNLFSNSDLPQYLVGDALRLEQILLNICSNALKFTHEGRVSLTINILSEHTDSYTLAISIKDSGIGISKEQQGILFKSFQQADNTTTRKYGGTGLGLAISKQLVELMQGSIHINSELGKGCEFCMTIPFNKSSKQDTFHLDQIKSMNDQVTQQEAVITDTPLAGYDILLVEDIEMNRMIATELLELHGAQVTTAYDGENALQVLNSQKDFDLVLMDIQMPVMDGYEATKAIRARPEFDRLPVLAMTANAMNEDIQRCEAAGMNGHIAKPIDEANMITRILTALAESKGSRA